MATPVGLENSIAEISAKNLPFNSGLLPMQENPSFIHLERPSSKLLESGKISKQFPESMGEMEQAKEFQPDGRPRIFSSNCTLGAEYMCEAFGESFILARSLCTVKK